MALQKDLLLSTGVTANYWRVTKISIDIDAGSVNIDVSLYLNKTVRENGSDPIYNQSFMTDIDANLNDELNTGFKTGNAMQASYDFLKTTNYLLDAIDV